jgi:hypothetical protein
MFATFVILVGACNNAHAMLGILLLNLHTLVFFCKKKREAQHRSFIVYGLGSMDKGLGFSSGAQGGGDHDRRTRAETEMCIRS